MHPCGGAFLMLLLLLFAEMAFSPFLVPASAQTEEKIPATTIIGTGTSIDFDGGSPSTTVNTIADAFDDDLGTFFAAYERRCTWVGLDLGTAHVITKIAFAPHPFFEDGPAHLLLGIFEGANDPDFMDAVPLLMITEMPVQDTMTVQDVVCSKGFRYVRFVAPSDKRCLIAEIAFYGYEGAGDNSLFLQLTNLPTVVIHTEDNEDITSKDYYLNGYVSIIHDDGKSLFADGLGIRGRGHSSWTFPKKSYRIKLFNKVNLLGFPARERNWTLVANYGDKTLMRNLLAFDLSRRLEMAYTAAGMPVDVVLNGEYQGTYNLCDQLEVAPGRVEVQEMTVDDVAPPNLTGGYLLEVDAYAEDELNWFASTLTNTPVRIRYPKDDEIASEQYHYIWNHYNEMEEALFASDYENPLDGYRKYIDLESFIRHFLVGEISGNTDTYWSVYMYKERGDDIFRFGPVWDFDLAFENDHRTYPLNEHFRWAYQVGSTVPGFHAFVTRLFSDESFVERVKEIYAGYRESGVLTEEPLLQVVDHYAEVLHQSQQLNFMRWDIMDKRVHLNPVVHGSYEAEVDNVKRYISERFDWMDYKLNHDQISGTPGFSGFSSVEIYARQNAISFRRVSEPATIAIVDVMGRVVVSKYISDDETVAVSRGLYFVSVTDRKGNRHHAKCMVP